MRAILAQIETEKYDWYDNPHPRTLYKYKCDNGTIEQVDSDDVPEDCKTIGCKVELEYRCFAYPSGAWGYKYFPRRLTLWEEWNDPRERRIRELYAEYENKLNALDEQDNIGERNV